MTAASTASGFVLSVHETPNEAADALQEALRASWQEKPRVERMGDWWQLILKRPRHEG